jgi:hypothetical protein
MKLPLLDRRQARCSARPFHRSANGHLSRDQVLGAFAHPSTNGGSTVGVVVIRPGIPELLLAPVGRRTRRGTNKKSTTLYTDKGRIERHIVPLIGRREFGGKSNIPEKLVEVHNGLLKAVS